MFGPYNLLSYTKRLPHRVEISATDCGSLADWRTFSEVGVYRLGAKILKWGLKYEASNTDRLPSKSSLASREFLIASN
jgi:hypothetical protein